jgi:hypothetical protein
MYFVAALLMGLVFLGIIILALIPPGTFSRPDEEDLFIPGTGEVFVPENAPRADTLSTEVAEDLHLH